MNMSFYTGATGARQFTKKLSVTANNLANINTRGYKPKTAAFSQLVQYNLNDSETAQTQLQAGAGVSLSRTWTDFGISGATQTGAEYDYAIMEPNAFFMIQDPETGEISYTRDGHFHSGERGWLLSHYGQWKAGAGSEPGASEAGGYGCGKASAGNGRGV